MASILKVDDLRGNTSAGDITITSEGGSSTQSLQQGLAKAWNNTNSAGTAINNSFNISSLTDHNTGRQIHNVTNIFSDANHAPVFSIADNIDELWTSSMSTGGWRTNVYDGSYQDSDVRTSSTGDLA